MISNYTNKILTLATALLLALSINAQNPYGARHYENWTFGNRVSMNFTGGIPTHTGCTLPMTASEGCASYSDPTTGALIAYTNGQSVYNGTNNLTLANGTGLIGSSTAIESGMILPKPGGTPGQFYVFHNNTSIAYWSECDMGVGPNGTVTSKNNLLNNTSSERFGTVPHANGVDYWVLCNQGTNQFIAAYLVTNAGISATPVLSATGIVGGQRRGNITVTSDFKTLGMSVEFIGMYLFDFDNCTGQATNPQKIGSTTNGFGSAFSADNSKVYYTNGYGQALYQYDRNTTIETQLATSGWSYCVLAPDAKIYVSKYGSNFLGVVNSPNVAGVGSTFNATGFSLGSCQCYWGLPNPFFLSKSFLADSSHYVTVCQGDSLQLNASGGSSVVWSTGAPTNSIYVTNPGTYVAVISHSSCATTYDTFYVSTSPASFDTVQQSICSGDSLLWGSTYRFTAGYYGDTLHGQSITGCDSIRVVNLTVTTPPFSTGTIFICQGDSAQIGSQYYYTAGVYNDTLTTSTGCDSLINYTLVVNPTPTVTFTATSQCEGDSNLFNNTSTIGAGTITGWQWSYGDGNNSTQFDKNHLYNGAGNYTVRLIATSDSGCVDSASMAITVYALPVVSYTTQDVCEGTTTNFNNTTTGAVAYNWKFGDGNTSTNTNGTNQYGGYGTYTTWLIATSQDGCVDSATQVVNVHAMPTVDFTSNLQDGCPLLCVDFTDMAAIAQGSITTYDWDLGTGTANGPNATMCYDNITQGNATIDIKLTVTSDQGCVATITKTNYITVYPNPIANFEYSPDLVTTLNPTVHFQDQSGGATQWQWDFGDGNTSTSKNPENDYTAPGSYEVWQYVTNQYGCRDSILKMLEVRPEFTIYFPNTFTPNGDIHNHYWKPKGYGIAEMQWNVFDRWGELIYTGDIDGKWDGKFKGEDAKTDVYVYKARVVSEYGDEKYYRGHINLLR